MQLESHVRSYSRTFPAMFSQAIGSTVIDIDGNTYLDFLSGCGSLNYGHNNPVLRDALVDYILHNGITMSLDLSSASKARFLQTFARNILEPRSLDYKLQFPGPTGTNAVEAAIKLARKVTGRSNIIAFTNGFHGVSLGALSLTGSSHHRQSSIPLLSNVTRFPYDNYFAPDFDSALMLEKMLRDPSSGCDAPAAVIFETVQGEGGLNVASKRWTKQLAQICREFGALLIVDDIQAGCGRTGTYFSFEELDVTPDIVCLAKSISGFGLPMSLVLLKPELDAWLPGEHNGTFRGNNYAFVTAAAAIDHYWTSDHFQRSIQKTSTWMECSLQSLSEQYRVKMKGRGMMLGLDLGNPDMAKAVQDFCFRNRLLVERCGPHDEVLKLLPPLTVSSEECEKALAIIDSALSKYTGLITSPTRPKFTTAI